MRVYLINLFADDDCLIIQAPICPTMGILIHSKVMGWFFFVCFWSFVIQKKLRNKRSGVQKEIDDSHTMMIKGLSPFPRIDDDQIQDRLIENSTEVVCTEFYLSFFPAVNCEVLGFLWPRTLSKLHYFGAYYPFISSVVIEQSNCYLKIVLGNTSLVFYTVDN